MPPVIPAPWVPFRVLDDQGDPASGAQVFGFAAGTDTPQTTYSDPGGTTPNAHPAITDDAGYANIYLAVGDSYKLRVLDANDVLLWEVDQVSGSGSGGGGGTTPFTATLQAQAGQAVLVAAGLIPQGGRVVGVDSEVPATFGTSGSLTSLLIGGLGQEDGWGESGTTQGSETGPENYRRGDLPIATFNEDVTVTAVGGLFDSAGTIQLTAHVIVLA